MSTFTVINYEYHLIFIATMLWILEMNGSDGVTSCETRTK